MPWRSCTATSRGRPGARDAALRGRLSPPVSPHGPNADQRAWKARAATGSRLVDKSGGEPAAHEVAYAASPTAGWRMPPPTSGYGHSTRIRRTTESPARFGLRDHRLRQQEGSEGLSVQARQDHPRHNPQPNRPPGALVAPGRSVGRSVDMLLGVYYAVAAATSSGACERFVNRPGVDRHGPLPTVDYGDFKWAVVSPLPRKMFTTSIRRI